MQTPSDPALELIGLVQRLSLARSLPEIQSIVRSGARRLTGADGATFVLRDGDRCFYADEDAIEPLWKGQRFPLGQCISGWAMNNRRSVAIGYLAHIAADACTPGGVPVFAPLSRRRHWLLPRPARIPTGSLRELAVAAALLAGAVVATVLLGS